MVKVVHLMKEKYDICIGRPSKWGNPFTHKDGTRAVEVVESRDEAIDRYKEYLESNEELMNSLHELKYKTLGCWCKPLRCHGDILAEKVRKLEEEDEGKDI